MDITYISIDVETDGPSPIHNSLLSIGAVVAGRQRSGEYRALVEESEGLQIDLTPITAHWDPKALEATGISRQRHEAEGLVPERGLQQFQGWVERTSRGTTPVMVGYAVAFDWMFLTAYSHKYLGLSPFQHSRFLDIKSLFIGRSRIDYEHASRAAIQQICLNNQPINSHVALEDAIEQAHLFNGVLAFVPEHKENDSDQK